MRRFLWNLLFLMLFILLGFCFGVYVVIFKMVGKNDYFDFSYFEKFDIRLVFVFFDFCKFGKFNYKDLKVKFVVVLCGVFLFFI